MAWRVARSILALQAQLKAGSRAAPPATGAAEWGTIGDTAHTSTSDHSPHDFPGWGNDIVTAGDFPDRPDLGLDARQVLDDIRRSHDPRVKYGISHGQMFSSYATSAYPAWTWRPYSGSDGHWTHGHLSVVGDARADGEQPWQTLGGDMTDSQAMVNTHDRVQAILTLEPYGAAKAVPLAGRLAAILSQASSNGGSISSVLSMLSALRTEIDGLRVDVDALSDPEPAVLTEADREDIARRVVEQLGALRFVADPAS